MSKKKSRDQGNRFKVKRAASAPLSKVRDLINKTQFEQQVLDSENPSIIDFWADWCVPCKMTAPAFAAAAERYGDKVNFCKVNTEKNRTVAESFRIRSIPTMILMHHGEVVDIHIGAANQSAIERMALKLIALAEKATRPEHDAVDGEVATGFVDKVRGWFGRDRRPQQSTVADGGAPT
ncbi:MAG: thioredoxin [Pseudomonadota bacterium]